jgi:hypothetical protein
MARDKTVLNRRGVDELLNAADVRADLANRADAVEAEAKRIAPVDTGEYRDSIHRESATTDRAVERVVASAPHAGLVEARTGVLVRALNAAG